MREALKGKKTYIFAAIGAVVAAGGYVTETLTLEQAIAVFMAAMSGGLAGLRGALKELEKKGLPPGAGLVLAVALVPVVLTGCAWGVSEYRLEPMVVQGADGTERVVCCAVDVKSGREFGEMKASMKRGEDGEPELTLDWKGVKAFEGQAAAAGLVREAVGAAVREAVGAAAPGP